MQTCWRNHNSRGYSPGFPEAGSAKYLSSMLTAKLSSVMPFHEISNNIDSLNIGKVYVNGSNFRNTSYVFVLRDGRTIGCGGDIIKNHSPSKIGEIIQFLEISVKPLRP